MRTQSVIGKLSTVGQLPATLAFVSDSQDIEPIKELLGRAADDYAAFFVGVADGDCTEIWGIVGIIPLNSVLATRLL